MEQWMSFAEVDARSKALAAWLQSLGLEPGARVAIMLPNVPQFTISMTGVLRAGFTCVNVNPLYTPRELEHQLNDSGATAIIILENFATTLAQVVHKTAIQHIVVTQMGDELGALFGRWISFAVKHLAKMVPNYSWQSEVPPYRPLALHTWKNALHAGRHMQYTGGTTGLSKGAMLTQRNIIAAALQAEAWFNPALARVGDASKINSVAALPLYHIFALTLCLLAIRQGSLLTLVPNPRDIGKFIQVLKKRPFHLLPAVNTLFNALMAHPDFKTVDFSQLCVSQAGGMAAAEGTAKHWQELTGSTMIEGWGMSETCAIGTNNQVTNTSFTGTIGLPLPGIDIAIKDDQGQDVALGMTGEVCIRGPNVMLGYYQQPEENKKSFTADGYLRTGDVGIMNEEGMTRLVDRKKDMILVSGFNVYPNELEQVVSLCPGVLECAAVGVPDETQGESIKLFVVPKDPHLTVEQVQHYCHENLTGYKRPKTIVFREQLPKTNVGKILRRELRDAPAAQHPGH
jgi:acyl-CoA synthetase (AMP-forming)/AMP-acid ligase II